MRRLGQFFRKTYHLWGLALFGLAAGWLSISIYKSSISLHDEAAAAITQLQVKRNGIAQMLAATRNRSTLLLEMYIQQDSFDRDEMYVPFL